MRDMTGTFQGLRGHKRWRARPLSLESLENRQLLAILASLRLEATDLSGSPVTTLAQGQDYYLNALVKDLRSTDPQGVFSAYFDLSVNDNSLLSVVDQAGGLGGVLFSPWYVEGRTATNSIEAAAAEIGEAGAFTQTKYFGEEKQLFQLRFTADAAGTLVFGSNPAEDIGKVFALRQFRTLANEEVSFGSLTLNVVSQVALTNDNLTVNEDPLATTFNVLNNDPGGSATWTIQSVSEISNGGTVTIAANGKSVIYRPAADFFGVETFKYHAVNGSGVPGEATVTVTVNPVNDAPRNQFPPANKRVTDEDTPLVFSAATGNHIGIWDDTLAPANNRINLFAVDGGVIFLPELSNLISQGKIVLEGGANNTSSMQIRGLVDDLNIALAGMQFTPKQDFFTVSPSQLARIRIWTREVSGSNPLLQADNTFEVTVNSVNDAPVNIVPAAQSADSATRVLTFDSTKRISTSDVDVGTGNLRVTLSVNSGVLQLGSTSGITLSGGANNSATMTINGNATSVNNALLNLRYTGNVGTTSDVLTVLTSDLDGSGSGGAKTDQDTVNITIAPQNQAPTNTVPGAQTFTATNRVITFDSTKRISVSDADAGNANLRVTIWVNNGLLKLGSTTGLTFLNGTADNRAYILFDGNQTNINAALLNLRYTANAGATADTFTIDTNDLGNTGAGGSKTDRDTISLTQLGGVNQAPVHTVPGAQTFTSSNRIVNFDSTKRISVNDVDAGNANLRVTVWVNNGILKLGSVTGLTFRNGTTDNSRYILFDGNQTNINAALLNLRYTANAGATSDVFTIDTNDLGNTGTGGSKIDRDTIALTQSGGANQAPVNSVPGPQTYTASNRTVTFGASNRISVSDVDAGNANLRITLWVNTGTIKLGSTTGLTFLNGTTDNSRYILFDGNLTNINAALLNLRYTAPSTTSSDVLNIDTNDLGNSGTGGSKTDRDSVTMSLTGLVANQAPVNTVPGPQTFTATNRSVTFDSSKRISTNDPDVGANNLRITLWVNSGIIKLGATSGLTFLNGTADNSRYMLFDGTQSSVNNALLNLRYTANSGVASDVLTLDTYDLGNTGTGGPKSDRDSITLTRVGSSSSDRSAGGGSGEAGSRNSSGSTAVASSFAADQVFSQPVTIQTGNSATASVARLADLLASANAGRAKTLKATDTLFENA